MTENRLSDFPEGRFSYYFALMNNHEEKYCLCALNRIFGFEPKIARALISHFGSASAIFSLPPKELDTLLGPWSKYKGRICAKALDDAAEETESLSRRGISFIGCTEAGYPEMLLECPDAPTGLYVRSITPVEDVFSARNAIGIVGTRDISAYGTEWCSRIVQGLSRTQEKPAIISGLALGTDICAHRQDLECGMRTIAVMATGPESVYPSRHIGIAEQMAGTEGCALITDYPPGTAPLAIHFLRRNRIIAGLSKALILIESRTKGGGMMTSRLAFSYNRDVYALPGRLDDVRSQGCNLLIKDKTAEAIDTVEGLIGSLGYRAGKSRPRVSASSLVQEAFGGKAGEALVSELTGMLSTISRNRGISLDDLAALSGKDFSRTCQLAGMLEMEDLISIDLLQRCSATTRISR